MIGIWKSYADNYLIIAGIAMLLAFGLPLIFTPAGWARLFRWEFPQSHQLVVFLERSMGIVITIIAIFAFRVIQTPAAKPFFFDLMLWIFGGMILLHVYGAIRKIQPIPETLEIFLWIALSVVTLCFYPA
jgi:hypothetical protein